MLTFATPEKLLVTLRDGTKYQGILRSWDQFGNIFLSDSIERVFTIAIPTSPHAAAENEPPADPATRYLYADIDKGAFLVRGENIVLMGEIDLDRDDEVPAPWVKAEPAAVFEARREQKEGLRRKWDAGRKKLKGIEGFEGDNMDDVLL